MLENAMLLPDCNQLLVYMVSADTLSLKKINKELNKQRAKD